MAKGAKTRWVCPNGHGAVMGPRRPRRDNIVRYCLDCSKEAGKLVERVAPVVEAERERSRAASVERQTKKKARAKEVRLAREEVDGVDVRALMDRYLRLKAFRINGKPMGAPDLYVVRHADHPRAQLGVAHGAWSVRINAYPGQSRWEMADTLIHELAHVWCARWVSARVGHGREWKDKYHEAIEEAFPGIQYRARRVTWEQSRETKRAIIAWAEERGIENP